MKKQMLFAAVAGLTLVSAHPGPQPALECEARSNYPPCSRTVTDRCIQLYERGVRAPANLARNSATPAHGPVVAVGAVARSEREPVRVIRVQENEDIDVSYAGNVLQAPRSGHHPADVLRHRHGGDGPTRVIVERHRPDSPHRVVVVREARRAHSVPVAVAHAHPPRAHSAPHHAHPPRVHVAAAVAPRAAPPRRQVSMRVRRAGERG